MATLDILKIQSSRSMIDIWTTTHKFAAKTPMKKNKIITTFEEEIGSLDLNGTK